MVERKVFNDISSKVIILILSALIGLGVFLVTRTFENKTYTDECNVKITEKISINSTRIAVLESQLNTMSETLKRIESKVDRNYARETKEKP